MEPCVAKGTGGLQRGKQREALRRTSPVKRPVIKSINLLGMVYWAPWRSIGKFQIVWLRELTARPVPDIQPIAKCKGTSRPGQDTMEYLQEQRFRQVVPPMGARSRTEISWCRFISQAKAATIRRARPLTVAIPRQVKQRYSI